MPASNPKGALEKAAEAAFSTYLTIMQSDGVAIQLAWSQLDEFAKDNWRFIAASAIAAERVSRNGC